MDGKTNPSDTTFIDLIQIVEEKKVIEFQQNKPLDEKRKIWKVEDSPSLTPCTHRKINKYDSDHCAETKSVGHESVPERRI